MAYSDRHLWISRELTLNGATDLEAHFAPLNRVTVHKIALMPTDSAAGGATVVFERRRVASTDSTIETVVVPAADHQGDVLFTDIPAGFELVPGDRINLAVTESGTAPTALALVEYSINDLNLDVDGSSGVLIESA